MDNVHCTGTESTLISCSHRSYHNCYHFEDAGVRCTGNRSSNSKCNRYFYIVTVQALWSDDNDNLRIYS